MIMFKLHTRDDKVIYIDRETMDDIAIIKDTFKDDLEVDIVDIIVPDVPAKAINHIIDIITYGSTAVITEDVSDVVEAGKLFLNVDLSSGTIRKSDDGYEFEIEKGYKCRKYVCGTNQAKEMLYIYKEVPREDLIDVHGGMSIKTEKVLEVNIEQTTTHDTSKVENESSGFTTIEMIDNTHRTSDETKSVDINKEIQPEGEVQRESTDTRKPLVVIDRETNFVKKNVYTGPGKLYKPKNRDYLKQKQFKEKKNELSDIILNGNDRVRLYQHNRVSRSKDKLKYPGLIIDNEITLWSVCLDCCAPIL